MSSDVCNGSVLSEEPEMRDFPPLYKASGDAKDDRQAFFHILERLKTQKRTGWVDNKIPDAESISDHMYRMAVLAMCSTDDSLDTNKCVMMCLVHDLAEAQVGDIAPREGIPKAEKQRLEAEAMHNFVHEMLHGSPSALRIEALWKEYEEGQSKEACFVKDLDRFEMASQEYVLPPFLPPALEYERRHDKSLQSFFDSSVPRIQHPEVKEWGATLMEKRSLEQHDRPRSPHT